MPSLHHPVKPLVKRRNEEKTASSRKKAKMQHHLSLHDLPWKILQRPQVAGLNGDDGILELEEVEGVEVVYEETESGRVARFNVSPTTSTHPNSTYGTISRLFTMFKSRDIRHRTKEKTNISAILNTRVLPLLRN